MKAGPLGAILVASSLLAGCSSFLGLGEDEFACSGMPTGVKCLSALEVYKATDYKDYVSDSDVQYYGKDNKPAGTQESVITLAPPGVVVTRGATPAPDRAIPIRTPAKVIRIWIAPWEDKAGYLNMSGYTYTELETRRWAVGEPYREKESQRLKQIQFDRRGDKNSTGRYGVGRGGKSQTGAGKSLTGPRQ